MDITVRNLAELALDEDAICRIWDGGVVFEGSFSEAVECRYADEIVSSIEAGGDVFVMNI